MDYAWIDYILGWILFYNFPLHYSMSHHYDAVEYLQHNPFDIKFNEELSFFFGNLFKWSTGYTPSNLVFLNYGFLLGTDFGLYFIVQLIFFVYFGHYLYYIVMSRIYRMFVSTTYSLFLLFRSKRYNILKNRTEKTLFEMDQLVLGTIIFVPFVLAFPTVAIFYAYSLYILFEILAVQLTYSFVKSLISTKFEFKERVGDLDFFSDIPSITMMSAHILRSIDNMDIKLIKFSIYNDNEEPITFGAFLKGIPVRIKKI